MAMTVSLIRNLLSGLPDDWEVYIEALNSEDCDGGQYPVEVVETMSVEDKGRVVLREDWRD